MLSVLGFLHPKLLLDNRGLVNSCFSYANSKTAVSGLIHFLFTFTYLPYLCIEEPSIGKLFLDDLHNVFEENVSGSLRSLAMSTVNI